MYYLSNESGTGNSEYTYWYETGEYFSYMYYEDGDYWYECESSSYWGFCRGEDFYNEWWYEEGGEIFVNYYCTEEVCTHCTYDTTDWSSECYDEEGGYGIGDYTCWTEGDHDEYTVCHDCDENDYCETCLYWDMGYWCDNDVDDWGSVCWYDGEQDDSLTCYDCYAGEYCELCYED